MRHPGFVHVLVVFCAGACGRSGPAGAGDGRLGGVPLPIPGASPTPTVTRGGGFGDGHDGNLVPSQGVQPTVCAPLTLGTGTTLTLGSPLVLTPGDRLLVIQVQDEFAASGDSGPGMAAAGRAEVAEVSVASGNTVTVDTPLSYTDTYLSDATRRAQACKVPQYADVVLDGVAMTAVPWDGTKGGVVAFFASGTLTLVNGGAIDVSSAGFMGGTRSGTGANTSVVALDPGAADGGGKGHGIDGKVFATPFGRGNFASGGGGGNARSAGGGGGGNAGAGGRGGLQLETAGSEPMTAGLGGAKVPVAGADRLVMGGGGGAGHDGGDGGSGSSSSGGQGGGVIFVIAHAVAGDASSRLSADGGPGADGPTGSGGDQGSGAGGGGAGGTIVLVTDDASAFDGSVTTIGGAGGTTLNESFKTGPGGGGGGGWIVAPEIPSAQGDCSGGESGICLDDDVPFGATPGQGCPSS